MAAQELLDRVNQIDWAKLFSPNLSNQERGVLLRVSKTAFQQIAQDFKRERTSVERAWDARNSYEKVREGEQLTPLNVIGKLLDKLELALTQLEAALELHTAIPPVPNFGEVIYGDEIRQEWHIGSQQDAHKWWYEHEMERLTKTHEAETSNFKVSVERQQSELRTKLELQIKQAEASVQETKRELAALQPHLHPLRKAWMFVLGFIGLIALAVGLSMTNRIELSSMLLLVSMGALALGIPATLFLIGLVLYRLGAYFYARSAVSSLKNTLHQHQQTHVNSIDSAKGQQTKLLEEQKQKFRALQQKQQTEILSLQGKYNYGEK